MYKAPSPRPSPEGRGGRCGRTAARPRPTVAAFYGKLRVEHDRGSRAIEGLLGWLVRWTSCGFGGAAGGGGRKVLGLSRKGARGASPPLNGLRCGPHSCECGYYGLCVKKRNDARTELTTAQRGSLAGWDRNYAPLSMTHPLQREPVAYKHRAHGLLLTIPQGTPLSVLVPMNSWSVVCGLSTATAATPDRTFLACVR